MIFRGFRPYYARSGLNPNKKDSKQPVQEPGLIRRMKNCEADEPDKIRKYDSGESIKKYNQ